MKQTEIGEIPEDWKIEKIDNLTSITTGAKNTQDKKSDGKYPFFVRSQKVERIDTYSFDGEGVLTAGDGVGTGKIFHYINGKFDFHQRVYLIYNFHKDLDGHFFFTYFSQNFYDRIMAMTAKSSVDSVRKEMISNMEIVLPPKQEQKNISTVLADTDNLIQATEQLINKKQLIKTSTMQNLLTGKIRLAEFDTKQTKPSELGEIPSDWDLVSYGQVFTFLSTSSNSRADLNENGDYLYLHYGDIHTRLHNTIDIRKANLPRVDKEFSSSAFVKNGDLIMADASEDCEGIGKSIEISNLKPNEKMVSGLHTFLLRDFDSKLVDGYRAYIHQIPTVKRQFDKLATGLKVYGLSKNNLQTVIFAIPKKDEQNAIAQILFDMDKEIIVLNERLSKLKDIKKGLMQNLLTGKIRLTE